jgi:hypothetical protein
MIEERALGGRLAGTLHVTGAITATAMLVVPTRDFALDPAAVA